MLYYIRKLKEIHIISTSEDINKYELLLGDGKNIGLDISYKIQPNPNR